MAFLHEGEDDHNHTDEKKAEDRYSLEPQKAHLTGEFVIGQSLVAMHCII